MANKGLRFLKITKMNHTFPIDNENEHIHKRSCRCKPTLEKTVNGKLTWIHHYIEPEWNVIMTDDQVEKLCTNAFINSYKEGRQSLKQIKGCLDNAVAIEDYELAHVIKIAIGEIEKLIKIKKKYHKHRIN